MKTKILLLAIVFLAFTLRFYQLGKTPPALNIDEVAIGYNAYSILKTGHDEFGKFFPLVFRSYDDFKPPLLVYLTAPSIALFGLNDWAVRLVPALLGTAAVFLLFHLVKSFLEEWGEKSTTIALVAALLLAISPWHLVLTRAAFEVGAQSFFTILGLYLLLHGLKRSSSKNLIFAALVLGASTYLYQASKVFIPLLVAVVLFCWRKNKIQLVTFLAAFSLVFLPNIFLWTGGGSARLSGTSVFQNNDTHKQVVAWEVTDWLRRDRISAGLFHQEALAYSRDILTGYLSHFRGDFLFLGKNGAYTNYFPPFGLMYLWEVPFLLTGFFFLWDKKNKLPAIILTAGFLLAPLPAAITYGVPSPIRAGIILPFPQVITAIGLLGIFGNLRNSKFFFPSVILVVGLATYLLAYFTHLSFVHQNTDGSKNWYASYKEAALLSQRYNFSQVIVSTKLGQPHEFFLYALAYDPKTYWQKDGGTVAGNYAEQNNHFGDYRFRLINWSTDKNLENTLFIGKPDEFPSDANVLAKLTYLDNSPSLYLVGTK